MIRRSGPKRCFLCMASTLSMPSGSADPISASLGSDGSHRIPARMQIDSHHSLQGRPSVHDWNSSSAWEPVAGSNQVQHLLTSIKCGCEDSGRHSPASWASLSLMSAWSLQQHFLGSKLGVSEDEALHSAAS